MTTAEPQPTAIAASAATPGTAWNAQLIAFTRGWAFAACIIAAYVVFGLHALSDDRYLDDEGLLTYHYAEFLRRDFLPTFFWLKSHPALSLLNLPGAALGLGGFFTLHVMIGAAGLFGITIAARRAGLRERGLAPLIMATAPLYVQGGPSGIANVDGAAAAAGALALALAPAPGFLAGLAAGALPFVRFELGLLTAALLVLGAAAGRRWRFVCGLACPPLAYIGAGALYHAKLLWFVDFPPAWAQWDPAQATVVAATVQHISAAALVRSVGLTLPALPLLLARARSAAPRAGFELPLGLYLLAFLGAITLLPLARVAFGFDDRYYLTALPAVALLGTRAADALGDLVVRTRGRVARIAAAVLGAAIAAWCAAWGLALVAAAVGALLASSRARSAAVLVLAPALLVALVVTLPAGYRNRAELQTATEFLRRHRAELVDVPVFTNFKLLSAYAARSGGAAGFDIAELIQPDMRRELLEWSNPANGQRDRIWQVVGQVFYGRGADPADVVAGRVPAGAVLILKQDDIRTEQMFPSSFLATRTRTVVDTPRLRIAVLLDAPS